MNNLKIGMVGLDTSHCIAFSELLNDQNHPNHVYGGEVVIAYPGGSQDFKLSYSRVEGITNKLSEEFGIKMSASIEEVGESADAIIITSVDGRVHLEQFNQIASFKKPVFIDKPFTVNYEKAKQIWEIANKNDIPLMSSSSLRYAEELQNIVNSSNSIIGADSYGPMKIEESQPGLFWYGIHAVEMLYTALGKGCKSVQATTNNDYDLVVGEWADGRIGTVRGNRKGNNQFGTLIHQPNTTLFADGQKGTKPHYASLLEQVMKMFKTGISVIDLEETVEIIRFIEAANESRKTEKKVEL
ncbi:Gfo/Idh/MocA family protein [Pseudalkalibacillus decolorationis]|uniref:Gfo/Idh/MocA family protein n=1 Tax=Pseudalkalibacillus decolorationis TaxID=163879 RepID=UPI00214941F1|nr:Gfo/Idh/MocA family oxidoreductase [Pseudalkalibacillus decolorationis]